MLAQMLHGCTQHTTVEVSATACVQITQLSVDVIGQEAQREFNRLGTAAVKQTAL